MVVIEVKPFENLEQENDSQTGQLQEDDETETNWRQIAIAGLIWFLSAVENTVVGMSEWPYMHQIDPEATTSFFGFVSASARSGHAIFALVFTFWSYRVKHVKLPLVAGRVIALVACVIYLCVEFLPENRRWLMLLCYFLFGVGYSSTTVLRSFVAEESSVQDRSRAYAITTVAHLLSIVLGPMIQLAFAAIKYPGFEIIPEKLRFHIYSAPIWFALLTNIICLVLVFFVFKERPKKQVKYARAPVSSESILTRVSRVFFHSNLVWPVIILCWFQKMIANLAIVTLMTTASPLCMVAFGWDGQHTVTAMSIAQGVVGVLSIALSAAYIFGRMGRVISARTSFTLSLAISMLLYVLSYPWPLISRDIPPYDAATGAGCDPTRYDWCSSQTTSPWIWLPVVVIVMGIGVPFSIISIDTIYSKVLGKIDQSVMQGMLTFMEDLMLIVGPIYASQLFTASGQTWLWIINGIVTGGAIFIWLAFYPKLQAYQ